MDFLELRRKKRLGSAQNIIFATAEVITWSVTNRRADDVNVMKECYTEMGKRPTAASKLQKKKWWKIFQCQWQSHISVRLNQYHNKYFELILQWPNKKVPLKGMSQSWRRWNASTTTCMPLLVNTYHRWSITKNFKSLFSETAEVTCRKKSFHRSELWGNDFPFVWNRKQNG